MLKKLNMLPMRRKLAIAAALMLTIALMAAVPMYAWFTSQRKAAELYKVEYPNSLYLNAAHREDRMYFNMNAISKYKRDYITGELAHNDDGELIPVNDQKYVFSVSGMNTKSYKLQLAHTNNNQFTYKIYPAVQYTNESDIPSGTNENDIVMYSSHKDSHNENNIQLSDDLYDDDVSEMLYYVKGSSEVSGVYKNNQSETPVMKAKNDDSFYGENYATDSNVEEDDIPSYWQSEYIPVTLNDSKFCDYYIIEVTWEKRTTDLTFEKKETDMVYLTASRK